MKRFLMATAAVALAALIGCGGPNSTNNTSKVGGPGVKDSTDRSGSVVGTEDKAFSLDPPNLETNIKQGESKVVEIGIRRGKAFDQDVKLSFDNVPAGVTIDPTTPTLAKSEKTVKVTVKASDAAALGHHEIKIVGKPATGPEATNSFKVEVQKK